MRWVHYVQNYFLSWNNCTALKSLSVTAGRTQGSVYTLGLDRAKQVTENKPWFTSSEYMFLITFAFAFIYFEDFQILTKIHYNPYSLYKILKGSKFHNGKYHQISSEF